MEVTEENFDQCLPKICQCIKKSAFVAIDAEFTGISLETDSDNPSLFDSANERYLKHKKAVEMFIPCQLGVACFSNDLENNRYDVDVFNIFLFPNNFGDENRCYGCSCAALKFLAQSNFDFNKWINEGVPYLSRQEAEQFRYLVQTGCCSQINNADFIKDATEKVGNYVKSEQIGDTADNTVEVDCPDSVLLQTMLKFELRRRFGDLILTTGPTTVTVQKTGTVSFGEENLENSDTLLDTLIDQISGASQILRCISESHVPLIGHNMAFDLLFLYHHMEQPLPADYQIWKSRCHDLLPIVIDTKYILLQIRDEMRDKGLDNFSLGALYEFFKSDKTGLMGIHQPSVRLSSQCDNYDLSDTKFHEAGFDALASGLVFLRLAHFIASKDIPPSKRSIFSFDRILTAVTPFSNRINLIRSSVLYLNLIGPDGVSNSVDWLVITPKKWWSTLDRNELKAEFDIFNGDLKFINSRKACLAVIGEFSGKKLTEKYMNHHLYSVQCQQIFPDTKHSLIWQSIAVVGVLASVGYFVSRKLKM